MELELKHLAPYLPYGLKIQILNHKCDYVGIEFSEINGYYFLGDSLHVSYNGGSTGKSIEDFKPILRPLSDLNTEYVSQFLLDKIKNSSSRDLKEALSYNAVSYLFSLHFDVFNLRENDLCIYYNEL